ncbi:hypothetical protein B0H16DRAFT_1703576 [Mycena metata]|uniref:Uncharacterized protein n=1 Tax=Mycena metata TaxID=1033252 RepID=A0AAD7MD52_9AGAR|nr:hypothetical protein B0H16DRAFT_1703576 [Mycena metata]
MAEAPDYSKVTCRRGLEKEQPKTGNSEPETPREHPRQAPASKIQDLKRPGPVATNLEPAPIPNPKPPPRPDIQRLVLRMLPPSPPLITLLDPPYPYEYPSPSSSSPSSCGRGPARLRSEADAAGVGLGEKGFGGIWALGRKGVLVGSYMGEKARRTMRRRDTKDARYTAFLGPKGAGLDVCARSNIPFGAGNAAIEKKIKTRKVHGSEAPAPGEELATGSGRAQSRAQISPRDAVLPRKCGGRKKEGNVRVEGRNDAKEEKGKKKK